MKMSPKQIAWSVSVLIWLNALPYLSRLYKGWDWVAGILPDGSGFPFLLGLLFVHAIYSLPVIPFVRAMIRSHRPTLPWVIALGIVSVFIVFTFKDVDLCCDANAAITLVNIPLFAMGIAFVILAVGQRLSPTKTIAQNREQCLEDALKKATDSPGWLGDNNRR
jgi:hypothetical protein